MQQVAHEKQGLVGIFFFVGRRLVDDVLEKKFLADAHLHAVVELLFQLAGKFFLIFDVPLDVDVCFINKRTVGRVMLNCGTGTEEYNREHGSR